MLSGAASNIGEIHVELSQPNQDSYLINDEKQIYAVFDGHGDYGHLISSYLKNNLASIFSDTLQHTQPIEESFRQAFHKLDENICKSTHSESSGSTCVMAYVNNNTLYAAGVGDCTAMLVQVDPKTEDLRTTKLLSLHKLNNSSEQDRILQTGAQVTGEYIFCKTDPNKVINMTRSFGDQDMKSAGVISQPEISVTTLSTSTKKYRYSIELTGDNQVNIQKNGAGDNHNTQVNIKDRDTFLILTSDGLDQVESFEKVARKAHQLLKDQILTDGDKVQVSTVCSNLLHQLEDGLYERDGVGFNDDATIIVVLLSGFRRESE